MKTFTITEGKAHLSALVEYVASTGEKVAIGRAGQPMVQLVPFSRPIHPKRTDALKGLISRTQDYDQWGDEEAKALGIRD